MAAISPASTCGPPLSSSTSRPLTRSRHRYPQARRDGLSGQRAGHAEQPGARLRIAGRRDAGAVIQHPLTLKPGASSFLQTTGTGPLSVGSAQLPSTVPVGVSAIFTLYNGQAFLTEAGVGDAFASPEVTLPVDISATSNTGVAIFNPSDIPPTLDIWLLDESGANVGTRDSAADPGRTHPDGQVRVRVVSGKDQLPRLDGVVLATPLTSPRCAAGKQQPDLLHHASRSPGHVQGRRRLQPEPLLDQTKTGIGATSNPSVDATLPAGFKLSGTVSGSL